MSKAKRCTLVLWTEIALLALGTGVQAQDTSGRVFLPTPETISIHEFNNLSTVDGDPIPSGTVITDLSGNGLTATVEGNELNDLRSNVGDPDFDVPAGSNRECGRVANAGPASRVAVNNDGGAYEMEPTEDFSIELYVRRENVAGMGNWGILAGTWHSRNLIDDAVGDPDNKGAWYGYGLLRNEAAIGPAGVTFPTGGWGWVLSPVTDGNPLIGFPSIPEKFLLPWFEIPDGVHYVVLSVDRTAQSAVGYVDGVEVSRLDNLDPAWAFTTPAGRDHARFLLFTGENDSTLNGGAGTWMPAPMGTAIDAVRVQRKALNVDEVFENWERMQNGEPSPPPSEIIQAIVLPSTTDPAVDQCVVLNGAGSFPGGGQTIAKYEWKIGDGAFEEGSPTREVSFSSAVPSTVVVTLRITNSASQTSTASATLTVHEQGLAANFTVAMGAEVLTGAQLIVPKGSTLTLDGSASTSSVPAGALLCPISGNAPLPLSPITEYRWDLDGDGTTDDTRATFDMGPLNTLGDSTITLTVRNQAGTEASASVDLTVADSGGNPDVFHDTDDTLFHLEFNETEPGPVLDGTVVPDLSENLLDLTVIDAAGGSFEAQEGAIQFADNRALAYVAGGSGPRGEVLVDNDLFEMDELQDFTFEIHVKPGEADAPEWGDVAGTFRARTDGTEESARYGWGIMHWAVPTTPGRDFQWLVCSGDGGAAEKKVNFTLERQVYSYVACVVDRGAQSTSVYVNGDLAGQLALDPNWSFVTPEGYPHANFFLFTREQIDDQYANCPPGAAIDAVRLQSVALTADEVKANWENIASGAGANPGGPPVKSFHRGDPNDDGLINITDGIYILNFLFLGGPAPTCRESANPNDDATVNITDGIYVLNYLFLGGPAPAAPGPINQPCGPDPEGSPSDLGCDSYTHC